MPRQETEEYVLFETLQFEVAGIRLYLRNIAELVRLLPQSERDIAHAIDRNVYAAQRRVSQAIRSHSEFAEVVRYKHLRKEKSKCQK